MNLPNEATIAIGPQPGPQTAFLSSTADIVLYGGAAGGGKSFALLLEPLRHWSNPHFGAVIFRKNSTQVRNEGGLWDESMKLYKPLGATPREAFLEWKFPAGWSLSFSHLEHESTVYNWQGSQIPFIGFDEVTHFSEKQFLYMLSRNRSTSGVPGYVRATCNPDCDSWVKNWISWWLDKDGYPIPERSGVIRYFVRLNDVMYWADTPEELKETYGPSVLPKSFTFIPSKLTDNKILMEKDPSYLSNLQALSRVERARLQDGNWNIRQSAGGFFNRDNFDIVDHIPPGFIRQLRYWDRAATKPSDSNADPDWTRGLKMLKYPDDTYLVVDLRSLRDSPGKVDQLVLNTARLDGYSCQVFGEQDPGSAGVADKDNFIRLLSGFNVHMRKPTKDKETRAGPVSAQTERRAIKVLRAPWNDEFFLELENFPAGAHDDIVDTLSGAYNELCNGSSILDVL